MRVPKLFTIGVYGSTRASFFDALEASGIDILLDLRRRRAVRGSTYAYANAGRLTAELSERGIAYMHVIGLAPEGETLALQGEIDAEAGRLKSERSELSPEYIKRYRTQTLDRFDFAALATELQGFKAPVLFCIERIPQACHRSLVAPKLAKALGGIEVEHLTPEGAAFNALRTLQKQKHERAKRLKRY